MSYCLNPVCTHPQNSPQQQFCQSCGTKLLLRERYRAIKPIGQGGFGKTFLGVDGDKPSNLPVLLSYFTPHPKEQIVFGKATQLFNQEAERLDSLGEHPQIPELLAHFKQEGKLYLVQEYIAGQNLAQELQEEGVFSETQIKELLKGLLPVLQFIHENNVIHREIKPENIIRRNNGEYVLVDFGAARYVTGTALLKTGTSIGDVRYMSVEQLQGKAIFASDIYSLGLTCLHLLTQVEPWSLFDSSEGEWIWRDYVPTPISEELGQVLDRMVQKATKRRFGSIKEVLAVLNPSGFETVMQSPSVKTSSLSSEVSSFSELNENATDKPVIQLTRSIGKQLYQFDKTELFSEGLAPVEIKGKWGYIDETENIVIQPQFDDADTFLRELARVKIQGKWGYIDKTGKIITQMFDGADLAFLGGLARVKIQGKCGYINKTGKIVTQLFDDADLFVEGLALVKTNGKWGYIDKTGKIVTQLFDRAYRFSQGLALVETKGKWGYIDKTGKIVIQPQFAQAYCFREFDLAVVYINSNTNSLFKRYRSRSPRLRHPPY